MKEQIKMFPTLPHKLKAAASLSNQFVIISCLPGNSNMVSKIGSVFISFHSELDSFSPYESVFYAELDGKFSE